MKSRIVSSKQVEVNFLAATLEQLRPEIQHLVAREASCLRRLNELEAMTAPLPRDVLATIFECACDSDNPFAITLGSVCGHWRDITWSTPQLWTSLRVTLEMTCDRSTVDRRSYDILRLYFTNVKYLPLSLEMRNPHLDRCNQRPFRGPGIPHEQLFDLIFREYPERLGTFRYTAFTAEWWQTFSDISQPDRMISLERLAIGWYRDFRALATNSQITTSPVPSLTDASPTGGSPNGSPASLRFPYWQITVLRLTSVPVDDCLDLLLNACLSLKEFYCFKPRPSSTPFSRNKYPHLTVNALETLDWQFEDSIWTQFLLTYVNFPSLRTLCCRHGFFHCHSNAWRTIDRFIQNQQHLTTFEAHSIPLLPRQYHHPLANLFPFMTFGENSVTTHYLRGFFELSSLEELSFTGLDSQELEFIFNKLRIRRKSGPEDQVLPRLQALRINSGHGFKEDLFKPTVFSAFVKMLRSRRDRGTNGWEGYTQLRHVRLQHLHSLEEAGAEIDHWLDVLKRLMDEGLEVELAL